MPPSTITLSRILSDPEYFKTAVPFILYSFVSAILICSLNVQASVALIQLIVLSVAPFKVMPPPSAVTSVGVVTFAISIFLSSTVRVSVLIVVVVPETVRLPAIVKLSDQLTSVPSVTST